MVITGLNTGIIFNSANPNNKLTSQTFSSTLARKLIHCHLIRRTEMRNIPRELKQYICRDGDIKVTATERDF